MDNKVLDEAVEVAFGALRAEEMNTFGDYLTPDNGARRKTMRAALLAGVKALLHRDEVKWIVNDNAELGVMIHGLSFFLYKGESLVYEDGKHDDGQPMKYRPVFKREFGECCHPINHADYSRIGTVSPDDSDEWADLPVYAPSLGEGE